MKIELFFHCERPSQLTYNSGQKLLGDLSNSRFIWIDQYGGGLVPEVWFVIFQG